MIGALPWLSSDGWWVVAVVLWVAGWSGIGVFVRLYRTRAPEPHPLGPDPRPPALVIRRRPPYDWTRHGD